MADTLLRGHLLDADTGAPLPNLRVDAWDQNDSMQPPDYLGGDVSALDGSFRISFDSTTVSGAASGRAPNVYVDVFSGSDLVASTAAAPFDDLAPGSHDLAVPVRRDTAPRFTKQAPPKTLPHPVSGSVDVTGSPAGAAAGFHVLVRHAGSKTTAAQASVDPSGAFSVVLPLPDGPTALGDPVAVVDVWLARPGEAPVEIATDVELDAETTLDLVVSPLERHRVGSADDFDSVFTAAAPGTYATELFDKYDNTTLAEIREDGGVETTGDLHLAVGADRLDALALLDAVTSDPALSSALVDGGIDSLDALIAAGTTTIASLTGRSDAEAAAMRAAAGAYRTAADAVLSEAALALASSREAGTLAAELDAASPEVRDAIKAAFPASDGDACRTATGPIAYVSALVDAAAQVLDLGAAATPEQALEDTLFLPISTLSASCLVAEEALTALRPVAESVLGLSTRPSADFPTSSYSRDAYAALLTELGTTPAELGATAAENAASQPYTTDASRQLATRLGLTAPADLETLILDPPTVGSLETIFGLRDLDGGSPTEAMKDSFLYGRRRELLARRWRVQDWGNPKKKAVFPSDGEAAFEALPDPLPSVPVSERPRPFIDPDLIPAESVPEFLADGSGNPAHALYAVREGEIAAEEARVTSALSGAQAAAEIESVFDPILAGPSSDGPFATWEDLVAQYRDGGPVADVLARLFLDAVGFSHLATVWTATDEGGALDASAVEDAVDVLVEVWKRRRFSAWRAEERQAATGTLALSPTFFSADGVSADDVWAPSYRARRTDRDAWERTLRARTSEAEALLETLLEITRRVEGQALPALIAELARGRFGTADDPVYEAEWWLQTDLSPGPELRSTHVDHAIGVLQRLLERALEKDLRPGPISPQLVVDAPLEALETDWAWLGTYDTWRAAMSVFLYPENAATPTSRPVQSEAFAALAATALGGTDQISDALDAYFGYVETLGRLRPLASCLATERVPTADGSRFVRRTFAFAQADDGVLYWTAADDRSGHVTPGHPWAPVPGAPANATVLGAAPAELDDDQRYVVLLLADPAMSATMPVHMFRFDLEAGHWIRTEAQEPGVEVNYATPMALPDFPGGRVSGCVVQRDPTLVGTDTDYATRPIRLAWRASPRTHNRMIRIAELDVSQATFTSASDAPSRLHITWPVPPGDDDLSIGIASVDAAWELSEPAGGMVVGESRAPQMVFAYRTYDSEAGATQAWITTADWGAEDEEYTVSNAYSKHLEIGLAANRPLALDARAGSPYVTVFTWGELGSGPFCSADTFELNLERIDDSTHPSGQKYELTLDRMGSDPAMLSQNVGTVSIDAHSVVTGQSPSEPYESQTVSLPGAGGTDRIRRSRIVRTVVLPDEPGGPFVSVDVQSVGSLSPRLPSPALPAGPDERRARRHAIDRFYHGTTPPAGASVQQGGTGVDRFYLEEAFLAVPLLMADALRRKQRTADAVAWTRAVYDSSASENERVIYVPLSAALEPMGPTVVLEDLDGFDPLNPHAVFGIRASAQLRYVLTRSARAVLTAADEAFARDTPEAVSAARRAYARAGRLLAHPVLAEPGTTDAATQVQSLSDLRAATSQVRGRAHLAVHTLPTAQARFRTVGASVTPSVSAARSAALKVAPVTVPGAGVRFLRLPTGYAVPANPVVRGLRSRAENGLRKIRLGLNAAGLERPTVARETGLVVTGDRGSVVRYQPTPYRATFLLDRARQLAGQAQQAEAAFLQAIERFYTESFSQLQAQQQIEVATAGVRLQDLRVNEAAVGVQLAGVQLSRASLQRAHFEGLVTADTNSAERAGVESMESSMDYLVQARRAGDRAAVSSLLSGLVGTMVRTAGVIANAPMAIATFAGGVLDAAATQNSRDAQDASSRAQQASLRASIYQQQASYERRAAEWAFQRDLAGKDVQAAQLGIRSAQLRAIVVEQERLIAALHVQHATETAVFLATKFTNAELYAWMSDVLEEVFTFYVRLATSTARLALAQLAFERQEPAPALLAGDYLLAEDDVDRRGLTGSARLLADLTRVEQHALETDRRALQMVKTVSLSQQDPAAFEAFRRTGRLPFALAPELFDRDHPGHYLRLVRSVSVTVVALVPPTQGIRATLLSGGLSPVVVEDSGAFRSVLVRRDPERVALSSPYAATGVFELGADGAQRYLPFEGGGVSGGWQLDLPKAANPFDYGSIADVLVTVQYTAHHSDAYRAEVIDRLGRTLDAARPLSFRDDFADAWYDALNADRLPVGEPAPEAAAPGRPLPTRSWVTGPVVGETERSTWDDVVVEVPVERTDFPPNLSDLELLHAAVYAVRPDGVAAEFDVAVEFFRAEDLDGTGTHGPAATLAGSLREGLLSSRSGAATATGWNGLSGPVGVWRFTFDGAAQAALTDDVDDLLLVLSYRAETPAWIA